MGKRENAGSPFSTVFSKDLNHRHVKSGLVWEWVKEGKLRQGVLREVEFLHLAPKIGKQDSQDLCNGLSRDAILILLSWGKDSMIENFKK